MKTINECEIELIPQQLSHLQILVFGTPMFPLAIGFSVLIMFMPTYYGLNLGLGLGLVGMVFAAGRIFDFITDPIIGLITDRTPGRFGPRKPWIALGLFLFCLATYLLFLPPTNVKLHYLFFAACLYFLSFTISEIPLAAMGLEISADKNERTRLAASKLFFFISGGITGAAIPAIWDSNLEQAFRYAVIAIVTATLIVLPLFLLITPTTQQRPRKIQTPIFESYRGLLKDKNIRRIIGVFFIIMISASVSGSLSLLYVSYILEQPKLIGAVWIASGVGILCGLPIWYIVSKKLGKLRAWRVAIFLGIISGLPLLALGKGDAVFLIAISFALGICGACERIMPVSLLADHVAKLQDNGGTGQAGGITGLKNATSKLSVILPLFIAFPILSALGLDRTATDVLAQSVQLDTRQAFALVGLYAGVPISLRIFAYIFMKRLWGVFEKT